ncbi:unnamed protein product [Ectocarpus sp. 6 AP-2014]
MKACAFIAALVACATKSLAFVAPLQSSTLTFSSPRSSLAAAATATSPAPAARQGVSGISMKRKGKPNTNIAQRGSFNQMQQQDMQYQEQRKAMQSGMPSFQIYVRTKVNNMWYPCGLMQGDDKAKATVDAMISGLLKDVSKYSLEKGVASSVLANRKDLIRQVSSAYPQIAGKELTFGFKVIYADLEAKMGKQEVTEITKDMTLGPLDAFKKKMGF